MRLKSKTALTLNLGLSIACLGAMAENRPATENKAGTAPETRQTLNLTGLKQPVEILKDRWGIAHIYAKNESDLFFAQGYNVASDRLFQLEMWRRRSHRRRGRDPGKERAGSRYW